MKLSYHPHILTSAQLVAPITVKEMCRMWWRRDNRNPEGDKVPLGDNRVPLMEIVFKEMIWCCLMYPPFWFLHLNLKRLHSYYWKGNIQDHYSRKSHHIFQMFIHNFYTGFLASKMEGHTKLR